MLMALDWRDSTTYQAILRDGREQGLITGRIVGAQRILVRQGFKRFGAPGAGILVAIGAIRDLEWIDALADRIIDPDVRDWNEWLRTS
jgi:hypothetical protein